MFQTSKLYPANLNSKANIVINQGGTDSGKTYTILQVLVTIACCTKAPNSDPIISVVNESVPNSKKGPYRTFKSIANNDHVRRMVDRWDEGERVIYFKTGWVIEFLGVTDEQNAKQGKRQYLFVNEANGIPWNIFWQYAKRTRTRVYIDYNPSAPFWAHDRLIGTTPSGNDLHATVELIISDHRHNPFLSNEDHARTENIRDAQLFKVYARGKTGNLTGLIFPNWKKIPDKDFPENERRFGGLDFGYTVDPTAGVDCRRVGNKIYVREVCYESGLTAGEIKSRFKLLGYKSETPVYCEHDVEMQRQLRLKGVMAVSARKGPNSVNAGILMLNKDYEVYYTESSFNIDEERRRYMWETDPITKRTLGDPIDAWNHCMDAIRYAVYTRFLRSE